MEISRLLGYGLGSSESTLRYAGLQLLTLINRKFGRQGPRLLVLAGCGNHGQRAYSTAVERSRTAKKKDALICISSPAIVTVRQLRQTQLATAKGILRVA